MSPSQTDDCCGLAPEALACPERGPAQDGRCQSCNGRLKPVSWAHVMHHLVKPERRSISGGRQYGFCAAPGCMVVYVESEGDVVTTGDVRHAPAHKTGRPEDLLCFCFDVSGTDALSAEGDSMVDFITRRVRAGDCACDVLNPSAGCCLGSVATFRKGAGQTRADVPPRAERPPDNSSEEQR